MKDVKFCILRENKETVLASIVKDTFTFSFLLLCIYISKGSNWWTFLTGVMFLLFLSAKNVPVDKRKSKKLPHERGSPQVVGFHRRIITERQP